MLPYVCLDMYEGIILRRDSTLLQGAIFRGLKACIGIIIESEKFLIIIHHPAFLLSNTFSAIQYWTQKTEFGAMTDIHIYKNVSYPENNQYVSLAEHLCTELRAHLDYRGMTHIHRLTDINGIFQINKDTVEAITLTHADYNSLEPRPLNYNKTVMSRAHYLTCRLAYHRQDMENCGLKIMVRSDFEKNPAENTMDPDISEHLNQLHTYSSNRMRELAFQLCTNPIWTKVLDLDLVSSPEQLRIKLENYGAFLLQMASIPVLVKKQFAADLRKLSSYQEQLMALIPRDEKILSAMQAATPSKISPFHL